ncbi:hypothetical protein Mzhil_0331 [Methanosalsum zhilinae DSM 4017]|uniref:PGF-CTERM archaeal protein-sorting signal domain-containing protein n=1 Tax=Methanosalsum zhilinae (strain DSM 4017 / NBRC 107636 / OCM 62 / WeN5) TaxID=679901 RepID=F7XP13_METZD|nr:PGF-CTERM sorting domain-containing protein [Methanosalsum zhilinae]AEH60207.1 hypothetical protein Mzhil_0331 [Methanosalsum zhilinae DSM 4017]
MDQKKKKLFKLTLISCALMIAFSFPVLSHSHDAHEMEGEFLDVRNDIRAIAQNIHDNSEHILEDESLDPEIRAVAEDVHQVAHKVDRSAHDIRHYIDDGEYSKATDELEILKSSIIELNRLVHDLWDYELFELQHHVDEIHDDMHDLQHKFQEFEVMFYVYIGDREYTEETHADSSDLSINERLLEIRNEIRALAQKIHDESEYIAEDEALDPEIRDVAEKVHQLSHKVDRSAHDIRHYIDDGEVDKARDEMTNLRSLVVSLNSLAHELDDITPESHKHHADEVHHDMHALQHKLDDFSQLLSEWLEKNSSDEYDLSSAEPVAETPGFEAILTAAGLLAAMFIVRKIHD